MSKIFLSILTASHICRELLYYSYNYSVKIGTIVVVSIRNKQYFGIVLQTYNSLEKTHENIDEETIKEVIFSSSYMLSRSFLNFIKYVSEYNIYSKTHFLKIVFNGLLTKQIINDNSQKYLKSETTFLKELVLNTCQQQAYDQMNNQEENKTYLLNGVTGSGKTELCIALIIENIKKDKQILILVPEINLILQWKERIGKYLKTNIECWHSLSGKSWKNWATVQRGDIQIVIGARSALFLPFNNLGLIIIDEEHDSSFKQENVPIYNGRDMAVIRGIMEKANVILASATPSLESLVNVEKKKYELITLKNSFFSESTKSIEVIPLNKNLQVFSEKTIREIQAAILENKKTLIYVNKRGYGSKVVCKNCGHIIFCPNCTYGLVYHKHNNTYLCHLCHFKKEQNICDYCNDEHCLKVYGFGIEKIEEVVQKLFPEEKILLFSSDLINTNKKLLEKLQAVHDNEHKLIIGTQMLSKGHDIDNLKLVVILDANLSSIDFRGKEKLFQTLSQVIGRVGRRNDTRGKALIQLDTQSNLNHVFNNNFSYLKSMEEEKHTRQSWHLPPFSRLIAINFEHKNREQVMADCENVFQLFRSRGYSLSFPHEMPITKKKNMWRYTLRITLKANSIGKKEYEYIREYQLKHMVGEEHRITNNLRHRVIGSLLYSHQIKSRVILDVDPMNFS